MIRSNGPGDQGRLDKAKRRLSIARLLFSAACFTTFFSLSLRADSFSLEASPSTVYLKQDEKATSTITVHPSGGFNGSVTLLASRLPAGVTASFDPESTTSASKLVFVAAKEATTGLSSIIITGTSGNLTQSVAISLAVTAATTVRDKSGRPSTAAHFESWSPVVPDHATPPAPAAYRRGLSARTLRQARGRDHPLKQFEPPRRMNALVSLSISSPIPSPIRPRAVAATDDGRRAPKLAGGTGGVARGQRSNTFGTGRSGVVIASSGVRSRGAFQRGCIWGYRVFGTLLDEEAFHSLIGRINWKPLRGDGIT